MFLSQFDIFSGSKNSSDDSKTLVVGIPYASKGCGRVSTHIAFTDKTVKNSVGMEVEYSVKSIQKGNGKTVSEYSPGTTNTIYRIPFLSTIIGTVNTKTGVGVFNVTIMVCHINPETAINDNYDTPYCPLFFNLTTDARGHFESEIRISDPDWTRLEEHFNISASYTEHLSLDSSGVIVHEFEPAHQIVSMRHLYASTVEIIDKTAVSIFGSVIIDPSNTDGKDCVFAGVPVHLVHGDGNMENTTSSTDGSFNFTVSIGETAYVYIPDFHGYTWDSFVRSAVTRSSSIVYATASPTASPIAIPDYIATSEWPQDTGVGKGLYDFNWIYTAAVLFPSRILPNFFIGPPKSSKSTIGWYYFQTTFTLPDYANYECLSIPFTVSAPGSSDTNFKLNNRLRPFASQGSTLDHLHHNNTLIIGVKYIQVSIDVKVSVVFSAPIKQCPKTMPISTGISGGSKDYNWMVASSSSLPVTGSLDFSLSTSDMKYISSKDDSKFPSNHFVYQTVFTLPVNRNYSCFHLSIYLSAVNYNLEKITINDGAVSIAALVSMPSKQSYVSLAPYLKASNILQLTVSKKDRYSSSRISVVFGDVRSNECEEPWPQSTGISLFNSLDNNWRVKQNSTYTTQAVAISYILSSWIPESNRAKWIGLTENAYGQIDNAYNYTFETHFKLTNEANFPCLQIEFNLSSSCQLVEIILNGKSLHNCSAPSYCGVTSYKQTTLLLSKYLQKHNILHIIVFNSGNAATGIMASFASTALSTQCFTNLPMSTGLGVTGDLDNNWIAINDVGLQTTPVIISSFTYGVNWISSSIKGHAIYQTSFKLPAFVDFRGIKLPIMVGVGSEFFVSKIVVNGLPSFEMQQYFNFSSSLLPLALEFLGVSNIVEFHVRSKLSISHSAPFTVTFGNPFTDDLTPWPKSTGTAHMTSVYYHSVPVGFDSLVTLGRRLSQMATVFTIQIKNDIIRIAEVQLFNQGSQLPQTSLQFSLSSTSKNASNCNDGDFSTYCSTDSADLNSSLIIKSTTVFDTIVVDCGFNVSLYFRRGILGVTLPNGSNSYSTTTLYASFQYNIENQFIFKLDTKNQNLFNIRGFPSAAPTSSPTLFDTYVIQIKNQFIVFAEVQLFSQGSQVPQSSLQFHLSSSSFSNAQNCNDGDFNTYCNTDPVVYDPNPSLTIMSSSIFDTVVVYFGGNFQLFVPSATIGIRFSNTTLNTTFQINTGKQFIFFIPASKQEIINVGGFPSIEPTVSLTLQPSLSPTSAPLFPTIKPTAFPTLIPSFNPTYTPTSRIPTTNPTRIPSAQPTALAPSFDFNWMIVDLTSDSNLTIPIQYPSTIKISDSRYVLTPPALKKAVGLFNFRTSFQMLVYANDTCLQIPFGVSGTDSISYIRLNGKSKFYCRESTCNDLNLKLSGFESSNTLDIGVDSKGTNGASLMVIFSNPTAQCALKTPVSTRGSIRSDIVVPLSHTTALATTSISCVPFLSSTVLDRDYGWMVTTAPDNRQVPYFAVLLHAVPIDWYIPQSRNGWITSTNSLCDTMGTYNFSLAFTLASYSNYSCVKLPLNIAASDSIAQIKLNGYSLSLNISNISPYELHQFQLRTSHLQETNLVEIIFRTANQAPAVYVEIGQVLFDACISVLPQSTGRNEYSLGSLDENWLVSATLGSGQALILQEAVIIDSIPTNWFADESFGE